MSQVIIGIDIAKLKFDVARLCEGKYKHAKFANGSGGFTAFADWVNRFGDTDIRICMEATGAYSLPLAEFLADNGYFVGVINPAQIHAFGKSELSRTKTDNTHRAQGPTPSSSPAMACKPIWTGGCLCQPISATCKP